MTSSVFVTGDYLALGTAISPQGVLTEVSGGSYARQALTFTGTLASGLSETTSTIAAASAPAGANMLYGAIFDASTGGNMLAYWMWPSSQVIAVGTQFPATPLAVQFVSAFLQAQSGDVFPPGTDLGTMNGMPLIAGTTLGLQNGNLVAQPLAAVSVPSGNIVFQSGGITVAHIDASGNLVLKGTVTASGSP